MGARTKARRRALDILFEADLREVPPAEVLAAHEERRRRAGNPALAEYTVAVVTGVAERREELDDRINNAAVEWEVDRMPRVDRTALRIAVWEITCNPDVPSAVAASEAVAAVTDLSTDTSGAFVNGVLGTIIAGR